MRLMHLGKPPLKRPFLTLAARILRGLLILTTMAFDTKLVITKQLISCSALRKG